MEIVTNTSDLEKYMKEAVDVSDDSPILLDKFLNDAIEVDIDLLCDGEEVYVAGIMEHIEEAEFTQVIQDVRFHHIPK